MLLKLAAKNLQSHKIRTILSILSILIGTATLFAFFSLDNGIKSASFQEIQSSISLTQITVRPPVEKAGLASFLNPSNKGKISSDTIAKIQAIPGVKTIYPEINYHNFSSVEASLLGTRFQTDLMVFGLPAEFLAIDTAQWQSKSEPYPTLLPRKFLDLYNFTIANPQGLPQFTEDQLIGREITLLPNYSTFFPHQDGPNLRLKLKIIGFSDKINLIGITLPYELVNQLNNSSSGAPDSNFIELFVEANTPEQVPEIANSIENLGYTTKYLQKDFQNIESKFVYFRVALSVISLIIWITVSIAIIGIFLASITERKKEIGLLRAIGARKADIRNLILSEALILGTIGSLLGLLIGQISLTILNKITLAKLPSTTFLPEQIFLSNPKIALTTLIFGIAISIIAAAIPAHKATKIQIIDALKG